MAQAHVEHFSVKPVVATATQRELALHRTHNMLVVTIVGSMVIIVVAALFMTMF